MKEIDWKYSSTGQKLSHYDIRVILIIIWVTSLKLLYFIITLYYCYKPGRLFWLLDIFL